MEIDREIYAKIRELKNLMVPKEKRARFIKESTGFCAYLCRGDEVMRDAITHCKEYSLNESAAAEYIERAMKK